MAEVWEKILNYYEANPVADHFSHMKIGMFANRESPHDTMPKLKGRAIEVRNLMPALLHVWRHYMDPRDVPHQAVEAALKASCRIDEILATYPDADVLPLAAATEYKDEFWLFAKSQNAAALHFNKAPNGGQLMVIDVTIKTHMNLHGALRAGHLNPRKSYNYSGEDFMQKNKTLMQSCVKGNGAITSAVKHMEKYAFALHMVLSQINASLYIDDA